LEILDIAFDLVLHHFLTFFPQDDDTVPFVVRTRQDQFRKYCKYAIVEAITTVCPVSMTLEAPRRKLNNLRSKPELMMPINMLVTNIPQMVTTDMSATNPIFDVSFPKAPPHPVCA
jgi:hypothetical protein